MKACFHIALPLAALVLSSCAGDKKETAATSPAPRTLNERINEKTGFTQDSQGKWVPRVNRRSSFESKGASPYFQGEYGKKEYKAGEYAKKQWLGGDKAFDKKAYAGNTDGGRFMKDSRFDGQAAREGALSVLAGHVDVEGADYPDPIAGVVLRDPAKHRGDDVGDLPAVRYERLACPLALSVSEVLEGPDDRVDPLGVEHGALDRRRLRGLVQRRVLREFEAAGHHVPGDLAADLQPPQHGG